MSSDVPELTAVEKLALVYAPYDVKAPLAALLSIDSRLSHIAARSSEPLIAQMKLAWWRDAIGADPQNMPKGEPLLRQLAELSSTQLAFDVIQPAAALIDAWDLFLTSEDGQDEILGSFAKIRGTAIFGTYARWMRLDEGLVATAGDLGAQWALYKIGRNPRDRSNNPIAARSLRPLSILFLAEQLQSRPSQRLDGPRLLWHALTGR